MKLTKPFDLPELPYKELPGFSTKLFEYHHGKHHKAYINNLNKLLNGTEYEDMDLDNIIKGASGKIYNNAAQHWNHSFLWKCMTDKDTEMSDSLKEGLERTFGSIDTFKKKFIDTAMNVFGSGWVSLVVKDGDLKILKHLNADCPLKYTDHPLLIVDVWEHAFYLNYPANKNKYLEAFWEVIDWDFVNNNNKRV